MILVVNGDYCGCQGGSDRRGLWGMEEGCKVAQVMWQIVKWKSMAQCSVQIQGWIEDKRLGDISFQGTFLIISVPFWVTLSSKVLFEL